MQVRDAVAADAEVLEALSDEPVDAERLARDRAVRVAEKEADEELRGFVAFDAWQDAVHVTRLVGDQDAAERLLEEPLRFADREELAVEVVLDEADDELREVVENAGFEDAGPGPQFQGKPTRRYRKEVE